MHLPRIRTVIAAGLVVASAACVDDSQTKKIAAAFQDMGTVADEPPTILNSELPFRYPPTLYARKVQGNVTLRLFIDRDGRVQPESTRVEESSGYGSLDSAAVRGSQELRFVPAKLHAEPVAVAILFPVYFRHPAAPPLPGDTILTGKGNGAKGRQE